MNRSLSVRHFASACSLAALIATSGAQAQTASSAAAETTADEPSGPLGDIIVTARRRAERLQDVPLSVSAFSQERLEALAVADAETLNKLDPALVLSSRNGSKSEFTPFIRGQGAAANSSSQSVITYFAEVPGFRPTFFDLSNIQVLKGPQGTLFGETATGGVVTITPRKPTNDLEGYVSGDVGNYSYRQIEGALQIPIIEDKVLVRAAMQMRERRGYTTGFSSKPGIGPVDFNNIDTQQFRISTILRPFDNFEIYTVFSKSDLSFNGSDYSPFAVYDRQPALRALIPAANPVTAARFQYYAGYAAPAGRTLFSLVQDALAAQNLLGPRRVNYNQPMRTVSDFTGIANTISWDISDDITIKDVAGVYWTVTGPASGIHPDGSNLPILDLIGQDCIQGVSPDNCRRRERTNWSNDIQLQAKLLNDALNFQGGFYYRKNEPGAFGAPLGGTIVVFGNPTVATASAAACTAYGVASPCTELVRESSTSYAGYGQATYKLTSRINLTAGFRRTWDSGKSQRTAGVSYSPPFMGTSIPLFAFDAPRIANAKILTTVRPRAAANSYTLAADWKLSDDILLYATHRKGYKGGGVNPNIAVTDPRYIYGPETVKDVEVGAKAKVDVGGVIIRSSIAGYWADYSDIQRRTTVLAGATVQGVTSNVAAATIKGLELTFDIVPSPYFEVSSFLAYNNAKFKTWTEVSTCASQPYRLGCAGVASPASVLVNIDHVGGTVTANGVTERVPADRFAEAPRWRWSIRPTLRFGFMGSAVEDLSLSANVYYTSSTVSTDVNRSINLADRDIVVSGYTLADLRLDWANIARMGNARASFYLSVTNISNKTFPINKTETTGTSDTVYARYNEPRMIFGGIRIDF